MNKAADPMDFEGIIAFAIAREEDAAAGYGALMDAAETPGLKALFRSLREHEREHKRLLEGLDPAGAGSLEPDVIEDLGLTDRLQSEPPNPGMSFQDALIFAARKEDRAARLYAGLAKGAARADHRSLFELLAGQERAHKRALEAEYEKRVLPEN
jgi:rubrerythrin